ncbi:Ger(x)C family spore germination protein [Paenibacillus agricola]|uniref:Ger(X)C family spore germination protein n=1 Tax=Paenibacillus agricola TaxID=2716264 RepID=A0ABX0J851_9BACL|nr:Ger(x)C family spore germination protein [Paenibacillus agricola]NHN31501.1 Ger(x)C family spore germination protein [Paenibacillus agricola]
MKAIIKLCLVWILIVVESGCWDSKAIQNMAYVTAIGFEYKDEHFITYVQVLNFVNVAKSEQMEIGKNVPVWIGKGEGVTVAEALSSIYATSQLRIHWGHVRAIICDEAILKDNKKLAHVYDALNRYREIRYNILIYGTKESFSEILAQKSIFNLSPLDTLMDSPEDINGQKSSFPPQFGYKIIAQANEKGRTVFLPSISITKQVWKEDQKKKPMFIIDGAYIIEEKQLAGWFSEEDLKGVRWFLKQTKRVFVTIPDHIKPIGTLVLTKPGHRIQPLIEKDTLRFNLYVEARAYVEGMVENVSVKTMEEQAAKVVRDEILTTYHKGLSKQTDLLNLFGEVYRNDPKVWQRLKDEGHLVLKEDTLNEIDVKVTIMHTGKYKGRVLPEN